MLYCHVLQCYLVRLGAVHHIELPIIVYLFEHLLLSKINAKPLWQCSQHWIGARMQLKIMKTMPELMEFDKR